MAALPVLCFAVLFGRTLLARGEQARVRSSFLRAACLWGSVLLILTETLSLFDRLTPAALAAGWGVALAVSLGLTWRTWTRVKARRRRPNVTSRIRGSGKWVLLCSGLIGILLLTGIVALVSPPNNWDSLTYHMSRVAHWAQNQSVQHYPTHIIRQIQLNPWAEFAILNFYLLDGGDHLAASIQWASFLGCIIAASLLARQLGGDSRAQLLAAAFAGTLPMAILQASSTQNDLVTAFWLLCMANFLLEWFEHPTATGLFWVGASLGLALLTKSTSYLVAAPLVCWGAWRAWRLSNREVARYVAIVGIVAVAMNAGFFVRNVSCFGGPWGPADEVRKYRSESWSLAPVLSNVVRGASLQLGTPFPAVNRLLENAVKTIHDWIGVDLSDPRITWQGKSFHQQRMSNHEDKAGNPLHAVLVLAAAVLFVVRPELRSRARLAGFSLGVLGGFLLFCLMLKWQPWYSRLQLPLFMLGAAFVGCCLRPSLGGRGVKICMIALYVGSVPWVLVNRTRPLLVAPGLTELKESVLKADRIGQYFANDPQRKPAYMEASAVLDSCGVSSVGLWLEEDDWEYPLWALLRESSTKKVRLQHVFVNNASARLIDQPRFAHFIPDAIVASTQVRSETVKWNGRLYERASSSPVLQVFIKQRDGLPADPGPA